MDEPDVPAASFGLRKVSQHLAVVNPVQSGAGDTAEIKPPSQENIFQKFKQKGAGSVDRDRLEQISRQVAQAEKQALAVEPSDQEKQKTPKSGPDQRGKVQTALQLRDDMMRLHKKTNLFGKSSWPLVIHKMYLFRKKMLCQCRFPFYKTSSILTAKQLKGINRYNLLRRNVQYLRKQEDYLRDRHNYNMMRLSVSIAEIVLCFKHLNSFI